MITSGFRIGIGRGNIFAFNRTDGMVKKLYSRPTYPGIISTNASSGEASYSVGLADGIGGFSVALPGVPYDSGDRGQATLVDSNERARKYAFGYDASRELGYIQVLKTGEGAKPFRLQPKGGGAWIYQPTFPGLSGYCKGNDEQPITCIPKIPSTDFLSGTTGSGSVALQQDPSFLGSVKTPLVIGGGDMPMIINCGENAQISPGSTAMAGAVTIGAGGGDSCTIGFRNSYPRKAFCTVSVVGAPHARGGNPYISKQTAAGFTVGGLYDEAGVRFNYVCGGS